MALVFLSDIHHVHMVVLFLLRFAPSLLRVEAFRRGSLLVVLLAFLNDDLGLRILRVTLVEKDS